MNDPDYNYESGFEEEVESVAVEDYPRAVRDSSLLHMYEFIRAGCSGTQFLRKYMKNVN